MVASLVLAGLLLTATVTDIRARKVYNWTTYPGILLALAVNGMATLGGLDFQSPFHAHWGLVGLAESLAGCVLCGFVMLVCYVFFPGGVGGGDVKLLAMIGAFLGPGRGLEALLWTFVLGACAAIGMIVWRVGAWRLVAIGFRRLASWLRFRAWQVQSEEERAMWKTDVFLSPAALVAVVIVQSSWI